MSKRDWKKDVDAIRNILVSEWDPIGCSVPPDEYDGYIPSIYLSMQQNSSAKELAVLLEEFETQSMCLTARPEVNLHVAESLLLLMKKQSLSQIQETLQPAPPRIAIVLGSGLSLLADRLDLQSAWSFDELPGLVASSIQGHRGQLLYGHWNKVPVLLFAGRIHYYEGHGWDAALATIRLAADLGITRLILTNAAGGIRDGFKPGTLMLLQHHLKCTQPRWWAKGVQKGDPIWYDYQLNDKMLGVAQSLGIPLEQGIYACLTGPSYETPAEIRALRTLGCSAVGMSTALEAEAAYKRNILTVAISCITNVAAGLSETPPHHEEVIIESRKAAEQLGNLIEAFLPVM